VTPVGHRLQELGVARRPADVLRRTPALTARAARVALTWFRRPARLQRDGVDPVVPEVIDVQAPGRRGAEPVPQRSSPARQELRVFFELIIRYADPRSLVARGKLKLMKMALFPQHRILDRAVQMPESALRPDFEAPPDRRSDLSKLEVENQNLFHHNLAYDISPLRSPNEWAMSAGTARQAVSVRSTDRFYTSSVASNQVDSPSGGNIVPLTF
jgi:hypothetical protein